MCGAGSERSSGSNSSMTLSATRAGCCKGEPSAKQVQELVASLLTRPCVSLQDSQLHARSYMHPSCQIWLHRNRGAARIRGWACMVAITLGAVTAGSELADAVEPNPMPRSTDTTVTGTAGKMLAANPADFAFSWGRRSIQAPWGGREPLGTSGPHAAGLQIARLCVSRAIAQL